MRAYQIESFGLEGLELRDLPTPQPGPGQVLVALKAASLNYRDLLMISGNYNKNMPLPLIPLSDGAGEIVEVGEGVTYRKVGDRVAGAFFQSWVEGAYDREKSRRSLGGPLPGMLASHVLLDEAGAVPIPVGLSFLEASTLPCAGVTAWNALFSGKPIGPGDTVLAQGTGGVSMFALQLARAAGASVIATSSSDAKLGRAKDLGATETVNYRQIPEWGAEVRRLTSGAGVDCVIEVGGGGTMRQSLDAVRYGGRIAVIGVLAGAVGEIPTTMILHKAIEIRGIYVGSVEMFRGMNRAIEANGIHPVVDAVFEFEQARGAINLMQAAGHFGKIAIAI